MHALPYALSILHSRSHSPDLLHISASLPYQSQPVLLRIYRQRDSDLCHSSEIACALTHLGFCIEIVLSDECRRRGSAPMLRLLEVLSSEVVQEWVCARFTRVEMGRPHYQKCSEECRRCFIIRLPSLLCRHISRPTFLTI